MTPRIEMAGKVFGRLTVLELDEEATKNNIQAGAFWKCRCECGEIVTRHGIQIRRGNVRSCGCLQREIVKRPPKDRGPSMVPYRVRKREKSQ